MRTLFHSFTIAIILAVVVLFPQGNANKWMKSSISITSRKDEQLLRIYGGATTAKAKKGEAKKSKKSTSNKKEKVAKKDDNDVTPAQPEEDVESVTKIDSSPSNANESIEKEIIQKKGSQNTLLVDDSTSDDHSTISVSPTKLSELGLFNGDTVLLKGKKRKTTVAIISSDETVDDLKVKMTKVVRSNVRCVIARMM